jgi:hypothetical protein
MKFLWLAVLPSTFALATPRHALESWPLPELNFGVVKYNDDYQIYRSELLGSVGLEKLSKHLQKNGLRYPKTIIYMNDEGYTDDDLRAVEEYEGQQQYGYKFFHGFDYNYRVFLDGKNPYQPESDIDEDNKLGEKAKQIFGVKRDNEKDGGLDAFKRIMSLVLDPNRQPVLFHCLGGSHRTGMVGMTIRYIEGGEWLAGSYSVRLPPFVSKTELNEAQYEYFRFFQDKPHALRKSNIEFVQKFFENESDAKRYINEARANMQERKVEN